MLYISFLELHLITECLYPFTSLSLFPSSPNPRQQLFYSLAVTSFYVEVLEVHLCRVFKFNLRLNLLICFLLLMCTQHKIEKTSRGVLMLPSAWQCFGFLPPISAALFTFSRGMNWVEVAHQVIYVELWLNSLLSPLIAWTSSSVLSSNQWCMWCMFCITSMDPSWCVYEWVGSWWISWLSWNSFCCSGLTARLDYHMPCNSHSLWNDHSGENLWNGFVFVIFILYTLLK